MTLAISDSYQTQKHYCHRCESRKQKQKAFQISLFANDMHIHLVLLGLQLLKEADITQLQIVVTCKPCPPIAKPFAFATIFPNHNVAHHFPAHAMTLKNHPSALEWKPYIRIFFGEDLVIEGKGFQCSKVKTVFHRT